jgi:hypothetical protein
MSKDYKDGYREGFLDGFKAARDNPYMTQPAVPNTFLSPTIKPTQPRSGCGVCKMPFTEPWGYVCNRSECPTRVTSY